MADGIGNLSGIEEASSNIKRFIILSYYEEEPKSFIYFKQCWSFSNMSIDHIVEDKNPKDKYGIFDLAIGNVTIIH